MAFGVERVVPKYKKEWGRMGFDNGFSVVCETAWRARSLAVRFHGQLPQTGSFLVGIVEDFVSGVDGQCLPLIK